MTTDQLLKLHRARPFQPFALRLADGQRLRVVHPEFLSYAPKGRTAVIYQEDGDFQIVDLLLVTGLEVGMKKNNGKRQRRAG